ncbi:hypothetical protein D0466_19560 [Peribacillus glennii]|uniref:Uncharacterized protein n=1 Tax=Peribacillus glennii TaxID=2303991 RepID=A0A372L746_9BACI|nr:hypothetical protein D0466_19560 [Peribacillus glennii]
MHLSSVKMSESHIIDVNRNVGYDKLMPLQFICQGSNFSILEKGERDSTFEAPGLSMYGFA